MRPKSHSCVTLLALLLVSSGTQASSPETLFFVDENRLARFSRVTGVPERTDFMVSIILDRNVRAEKLLVGENTSPTTSTLSILDTQSDEVRVIAQDVIRAKFSPSARKVVTWRHDNSIELLDVDGTPPILITSRGVAPIFSHDGNFVAYLRLADTHDDGQELYEYAQGIAIYDLRSNVEVMVTDHPEDFAPVGFSADMSALFFNSTRPYEDDPVNHVASVWSVHLTTGVTTRLTNRSSVDVRRGTLVPIVDEHALWTSDRRVAVSATDSESGVWCFTFNADGTVTNWERVADGDSPTWVHQDQSYASRVFEDNRPTMRVWPLRAHNNGSR